MDIQGVAQLLGNFGEFFGAIAVVMTLVYLAGQLRQNTKALRSASYEHWCQQASEWAHLATRYAHELAEIEKIASFEELTPEQRTYLGGVTVIVMNQGECAFLKHRAGLLDDDVFESRIQAVQDFLEMNPLAREAWSGFGPRSFTKEFYVFLEQRSKVSTPASA